MQWASGWLASSPSTVRTLLASRRKLRSMGSPPDWTHGDLEVLDAQGLLGAAGGHDDLDLLHQVPGDDEALVGGGLAVGREGQLGAPRDELDEAAFLGEDAQALLGDGVDEGPSEGVDEEGLEGRPARHRGEGPLSVRVAEDRRPGEDSPRGPPRTWGMRALPPTGRTASMSSGSSPAACEGVLDGAEDGGDRVQLAVPGVEEVGVQEGLEDLFELGPAHRGLVAG